MSAVPRMTARVLRHGLPGLIALLLGIAVFEFIQPVVVASFGGAAGLNSLMERIPPALQAFARTRPEFLALSGLAGYLALGFTHPLYLVLAGAAVVGFAARSLAGEVDRGIMQIALSRPVSRSAAYGARAIGVAIICCALALIGPLGMIAGILYAEPGEIALSNFRAVALTSLALFWAIGGLSLLGSAAANGTGRVVGWAIGLLVLSYFVDYFAGIWAPLQRWTFLSLFDYYNPSAALVTGFANTRDIAILAIVGALATVAGLAVFTQRDLPV